MTDTVVITRPGSDSVTGVFDDETGTYSTAATDVTVYTGKAIVSTFGQEPRSSTEGEAEVKEDTYSIRIPLSAATPQENDVVRVTASLRDAAGLVNREFLVVSVPVTTFAVSRKMIAQNRIVKRDP